jgi:hypothetical protein
MASKNSKPLPCNPEIESADYRGPDQRGPTAERKVEATGDGVCIDEQGNSVSQPSADAPRRDEDVDTTDTMKHLNLDSLSQQGANSSPGEENTPAADGYNPYDTDNVR